MYDSHIVPIIKPYQRDDHHVVCNLIERDKQGCKHTRRGKILGQGFNVETTTTTVMIIMRTALLQYHTQCNVNIVAPGRVSALIVLRATSVPL